jgi:hypothetical protein
MKDNDRSLIDKLLEASKVIANKQRHGGTNHVITSQKVVDVLEEFQEQARIKEERNKKIDDLLNGEGE